MAQAKSVNGYTSAAIDRAFAGLDFPILVRVRAELLDLDNMLLFRLDGLQLEGSITHNVTQPLQRGADLRFLETERDSQHSSPLGTFADTALAQNRLLWLRLGETSGNFADSSGNARTFTANGTPGYSVGSLALGDLANNAIGFSGDDYGTLADAAWMDVTAISLIVAYRGTTASGCLLDRDDGGSNRFWRLAIDASGFVAFGINFTSGVYTTFTTTTAINDGRAHLIHATYNGVHVQIFVDGKRHLLTAETRTMLTGALAINVGFTNAGTLAIVGTLDEVGMIGRALSPKEIRDEYQTWSGQTTELLIDKDRGDRVKIYYGLRMGTTGTDGTDTAEWPQVVAILTSPKKDYTDTGTILSVQCQDQTRVLQDYTFTSALTLASGANYISGTNGILAIAALTGLSTAAWAVTSTALVTPADVVFEIGSSALDAINYLLTAINYKSVRFSGDGTAILEPNVLDRNLPVVDTINSTVTKVIEAQNLSLELEPRKVVKAVIVGNGNPDVTPYRGVAQSVIYNDGLTYVVQVDVPDQTTADSLAAQLLADEIAETAKRIRFRTLPRPIHDDRDRYDITIPEIGINTAEGFVEDSWTLPLNGGTMEHSMLSVVAVS